MRFQPDGEDRNPGLETGTSSTRCCIEPAPASPGVTCRSASALGKRSTTSSHAGPTSATGDASSKPFSSGSTKTESSSTHRLFEPTRMLRAERGDPKQCSGSLSRWLLHEGPRTRRRERAAAPHRNHAGPAARIHSRRSDPPRTRPRLESPRGHRLRFGRDPGVREADGHEARDSSPPDPQEEASARSCLVLDEVPRRVLLPSTQTLSRTRFTLRQNRQAFPGSPSSRLRENLAR